MSERCHHEPKHPSEGAEPTDLATHSLPIQVTRPALPELDDLVESLHEIWSRRWLTNNGEFHQRLERRLAEYLGVGQLSLFCNGTIALLAALRALDLRQGEVITTPFTFPATAHVLDWLGLDPVFCDIDPATYNLDPNRIEQRITPETRAILAVHVYGIPCDCRAIESIARAHDLRVVYDAAHAFGVEEDGASILSRGDISMLSFHATKIFSTIEGGALVLGDRARKNRVDLLKNFGIVDAETVAEPGINGKMNEVQAAFGLLQLEKVPEEIRARRSLYEEYVDVLSEVPGVRTLAVPGNVRWNYSYFPILVDPERFGATRDDLAAELAAVQVHPRKYFFPLASNFPCYSMLPSSHPDQLPSANRVAERILCLPLYGELTRGEVRHIAEIVRGKGR